MARRGFKPAGADKLRRALTHWLRHAAATHQAYAGNDLHFVQKNLQLLNHLADFVERQSTLDFSTPDGRVIARHGSHSVYWQAFWKRSGALYKPTTALHKLLDATDIADNVPLRLLRPPAPAMCIVPDPSTRDHRGGVEAIGVFSHTGEDLAATGRRLTFVAWSRWTDPQPRDGIEVLSLAVDDEDRPIGETLERAAKNPPSFTDNALSLDESQSRWHTTLNYLVKMRCADRPRFQFPGVRQSIKSCGSTSPLTCQCSGSTLL